MNAPIKAAIFDLDGTLIDSIGDIAYCANTVLTRYGYPQFSVEQYKELVGDGFANLTRKILPPSEISDARIDLFMRDYRDLYRENWSKKTVIYNGILPMLKSLSDQGVILNVLSNKRDDFTKLCVSHFFPGFKFIEVRGERSGTPIKPHPDAALEIAATCGLDPDQFIFVGDSEIDIETGKQAGMFSVGVLWGFRTQKVIEDAGAQLLVARPSELIDYLKVRIA